MTKPVVVADSGPLIALASCQCLHLLSAVFSGVHIPQAVLVETTANDSLPGAKQISRFASKFAEIHSNRKDTFYSAAVRVLDEGEAQALSLAHALSCSILIDERRGREYANQIGLQVFGVLGVLLQAKNLGEIQRIEPILAAMQNNGYRISQALVDAVLMKAGELCS